MHNAIFSLCHFFPISKSHTRQAPYVHKLWKVNLKKIWLQEILTLSGPCWLLVGLYISLNLISVKPWGFLTKWINISLLVVIFVNSSSSERKFNHKNNLRKNLHLMGCATVCVKSEVMLSHINVLIKKMYSCKALYVRGLCLSQFKAYVRNCMYYLIQGVS